MRAVLRRLGANSKFQARAARLVSATEVLCAPRRRATAAAGTGQPSTVRTLQSEVRRGPTAEAGTAELLAVFVRSVDPAAFRSFSAAPNGRAWPRTRFAR